MFSVNSTALIIEGTWPERATVENGMSTAFVHGECALKRGGALSRHNEHFYIMSVVQWKSVKIHAQHILKLMLKDDFPRIWVPSWENRDVRQLLWHRPAWCRRAPAS
jgi:hypothetical protein